MQYPNLSIFLLGDLPDGLVDHILAFFGESALPWHDGADMTTSTIIRSTPYLGLVVNQAKIPVNNVGDYYRKKAGISGDKVVPLQNQAMLEGFDAPSDLSGFMPYMLPDGLSSYDLLWQTLQRFLPSEIYTEVAKVIRERRSAEQKYRYYSDASKALRRADRERKRAERMQRASEPKRPRGRPPGSKNKAT